MKKFLFILIAFFSYSAYAQQMNVMSFNVRYDNPKDGLNTWDERKDMVADLVKFYDTDIVGMQEPMSHQVKDISERLPGFSWYGVGRIDGDRKGEYCPVFYKTSKFKLLKKGFFWLSETPDKPGHGWDAQCERVVSWGIFRIKGTSKKFLFINAHFDHIGSTARKKSALLLQQKIKELNPQNGLPVILMGDLNCQEGEPIDILKRFLSDSREISETPPYGPKASFTAFNWERVPYKWLDHIFVSGFKVLKYGHLSDSKKNRYPSDHFPVFIKAEFK